MVMCFVPDCKHYSAKQTCKFFRFPTNQAERNRWISLIRRKDKQPTQFSRVCDCHFVDKERKNRPTLFDFNLGKKLNVKTPEKSLFFCDEPTIQHSEKVSLLKDPLALDDFDDNTEANMNTDETKQLKRKCIQLRIITEGTSKLVGKNTDLHNSLETKDKFSYNEKEVPPELIKIEIEEDEAEESSSIGISHENYQYSIENEDELLRHNDPIKEKTRIPMDKPPAKTCLSKHTNSASGTLSTTKYPLPVTYTDLASVDIRLDHPLSHNDFASIKLNFAYNFNFGEIVDNQKLVAFTGVTNDLLQVCEKCMENILYTYNISSAKNIRLKIVLVLMKLKSNLSFNVLATVLGLKEYVCEMIFFWTLDQLWLSFKPAIYWFTTKELKDGQAKCFDNDFYKSVRVMLLELKFKIKTCSIVRCNFKQCGQYKNHPFIRVMIGLSPKKKLFSFVSNPYDYNVAVVSVLRKEKILSHFCNPGDTIIMSESNESIFFRDDFRRAGLELQELDNVNQKVKNYINQSLQKLEEFEILRNKEISSHMVAVIKKVVMVICGLSNLNSEAEITEES